MVPTELRGEDMATNFKMFLGVYASYADVGDNLSREYGTMLDIYGATGEQIDFIGAMYGLFRLDFERDSDFRNRITATVIERKVPSTLPELQQAINAITSTGALYLMENHGDKPCNVYLTGTADEDSINRSLLLIRRFLPAGVKSIIPVVSFERWQNIKDQFSSWDSLGEEGYIW